MLDRDDNEIISWIKDSKGWGGHLEAARMVAEAHLQVIEELDSDQSVEPLKDSEKISRD